MFESMNRILTMLGAVLVIACAGHAQICDARAGAAMQMKVQLTFDDQSADAGPGAVATSNDPIHRGDTAGNKRQYDFLSLQIRVQLQDPVGGTFQEQMPTTNGELRMTVCRKSIYRLRVTGPTIDEAIVDSVQPGRGENFVTVVLHRKLTKEERKAQEATVSMHRLRIPNKARKQLAKGDAAMQKGKLTEAEKYYNKAIAIYPQYEEARNSLGVLLMKEGKKTEGQAAFEGAVAVNHDYAPAQINLAKIAFDDKRYDDASSLARQALKSEPLNAAGLFVGAEAAFFKGEYGDTVSYTRTLHSIPHEQYGLAHYLAAKSLEVQHQPDAALAEYQTFLEEDPSDPNAKRARELVTLLQASAASARTQTAPRP